MAFPSSPANATIHTSESGVRYIYISDNDAWKKVASAFEPTYLDTASQSLTDEEQEQARANMGVHTKDWGPFKITKFEVSGTHTYDVETSFAMIYVCGGGGGGGGSDSNSGTVVQVGQSGGAGSTGVKLIDVANQSIVTATITVGSGGAGGTTGAAANGSNSEYTDGTYTVVAHHGRLGGNPGDFGTRSAGLERDVDEGTGHDWIYHGTGGTWAHAAGDNANWNGGSQHATGGTGGYSLFGTGGRGANQRGSSGSSGDGDASNFARGYGYGGGGGASIHNGTAGNGSAGGDGVVIIVEYK